jgi:DNA-binding Lrp family transcriptional regulator
MLSCRFLAIGEWTFLSNHAQTLLCIADDPDIRLRDIAATVGITERAAHQIVSELVESGYVSRKRVGRRNRYKVRTHMPLRTPLVRDRRVSALLELFGGSDRQEAHKRGAQAKSVGDQ